MKAEDSIFYGLGYDDVQVRRPQTFEEELIYIGPYNEVVNGAMMKVVENLEKIINTGLRESGIRFEVDAKWCNILDSERNPKGEYGYVSVLMHREKQEAMRTLAEHARKAWSLIETAPQDGTVFQAFAPHDSGGYQFSASVNKDGRILSMMCGTDVTDRVTLWQPLPEFPED